MTGGRGGGYTLTSYTLNTLTDKQTKQIYWVASCEIHWTRIILILHRVATQSAKLRMQFSSHKSQFLYINHRCYRIGNSSHVGYYQSIIIDDSSPPSVVNIGRTIGVERRKRAAEINLEADVVKLCWNCAAAANTFCGIKWAWRWRPEAIFASDGWDLIDAVPPNRPVQWTR